MSPAMDDRPLPATEAGDAPLEGMGRAPASPPPWSPLLLLLAAFLGDWLTGSEVASSLFYVIVIMFGAWFAGRRLGLALALLSVVAWALAHRLTGVPFSQPERRSTGTCSPSSPSTSSLRWRWPRRAAASNRVHALAAPRGFPQARSSRRPARSAISSSQLLPQRPPPLAELRVGDRVPDQHPRGRGLLRLLPDSPTAAP